MFDYSSYLKNSGPLKNGMQGQLDKRKIAYIWKNFELVFTIDEKVKSKLNYNSEKEYDGSITFELSSKPLNTDEIFFVDNTPILFPLEDTEIPSEVIGNSIFFKFDILKSIFYFLSGYQEYTSENRDHLDRYPFSQSIQAKLGIEFKAVVNQYYTWISKGINALYPKSVKRKKVWKKKKYLLLTHDIDYIRYFNFAQFKYALKSINQKDKRAESLYFLSHYPFRGVLNRRKDPYWSFDDIERANEKNKTASNYFFLQKGLKNIDARFLPNENPTRKKIFQLSSTSDIYTHGTAQSSFESSVAIANNNLISSIALQSRRKFHGNRQHRLHYYMGHTTEILSNNYDFDSTLGFAETSGFRNSICHPFYLYDFKNDKAYDVLNIPLVAMDVTLFKYMKLTIEETLENLKSLSNEISKFNGVMTLLWHNNYIRDYHIYKNLDTYHTVIKTFMNAGFESPRISELLAQIKA